MNTEIQLNGAFAASQDLGVAAVVAREAQEVQAAVFMAKKYPREQRNPFDAIMRSCARPSLAEQASYAFPRSGQTVTGPSVRLLEVIAQHWGNCHAGFKILAMTDEYADVESFCWDYETNFKESIAFRVYHVRDTTSGPKAITAERDRYENIANMATRRKRKCMENVIPGDIIEAAEQECDKTLGTLAQKKERVVAMVKAFLDDFRITRDDIERRIAKRVEAMTTPEFVQLKKIYTSLKNKQSDVVDWFPQIHDPEKIKKSQAEAADSEVMPMPADDARANAEHDIARQEFHKACEAVAKRGGNPDDILGCPAESIVETKYLFSAADRLNQWSPK